MKWILIYFICVADNCTSITATFDTQEACNITKADISFGLTGLSDNRKFNFFCVCRESG